MTFILKHPKIEKIVNYSGLKGQILWNFVILLPSLMNPGDLLWDK